MTPEERAEALLSGQCFCDDDECQGAICEAIAANIRAAEDEALERAALMVETSAGFGSKQAMASLGDHLRLLKSAPGGWRP